MLLKNKLKNNQLTIGSWITIGNSSVVEIMATAGFEWLCIDMEHTSIDLATAKMLIITIHANDMKALVRVSKNEEVAIKKVMDMGADGVIVPMIKTKEDALMAIDFVKYPPTGKRGVGLYRAQKYGIGFDEYKKWVEEEAVIIAQIEHIEAVKNIDEILSVDGIDGTIVGPYDLSGSMGFPGDYHREDVRDAIKRVEVACKKHNKPYGFHVIESDPSKLQERIDEGCTFLAYSLDFFFLGDSARYGKSLVQKHLNQKINSWNIVKQKINQSEAYNFREAEIYFAYIGQNIGYEVFGKGDEYLRPLVVLKKFGKNSFLGVPLTSKSKNGNFYHTINYGNRTNTALISQLKTFDAKRLKYKIGKLSIKEFARLKERVVTMINPSAEGNGHAS